MTREDYIAERLAQLKGRVAIHKDDLHYASEATFSVLVSRGLARVEGDFVVDVDASLESVAYAICLHAYAVELCS